MNSPQCLNLELTHREGYVCVRSIIIYSNNYSCWFSLQGKGYEISHKQECMRS